MLKNISRKAKSLLHDGPLSSEVEMKYVSDNRQRMMEIIQDLRSHNYEKYHFKVEELSGGMKTPGSVTELQAQIQQGEIGGFSWMKRILLCGDMFFVLMEKEDKKPYLEKTDHKDDLADYVFLFDHETEWHRSEDDQIVIQNRSRKLALEFKAESDALEVLLCFHAIKTNYCSYHNLSYDDLGTDKKYPYGSFSAARPATPTRWYVCGSEYMEAVAEAMENAKERIFLADWQISPCIYLKRPWNGRVHVPDDYWRLDNIIKRKAQQGVRIYILLYQDPSAMGLGNYEACKYLRRFTRELTTTEHGNVFCVTHPDSEGPLNWAHHEKLVVCDEEIAFISGMDLSIGRWDLHGRFPLFDDGPEGERTWIGNDYWNQFNVKPRMNIITESVVQASQTSTSVLMDDFQKDWLDRNTEMRCPWQDIGSSVVGLAASDAGRHFIERWNSHMYYCFKSAVKLSTPGLRRFRIPAIAETMAKQIIVPRQLAPIVDKQNQMNVFRPDLYIPTQCQVIRSSATWSAGIGEVDDSILQTYIHLIENAKRYIFIENQFFVTSTGACQTGAQNPIGEALAKRIVRASRGDEQFKIYIVIPCVPGMNGKLEENKAQAQEVIIHLTMESINRGKSSIKGYCDDHGVDDWTKYIYFGSYRKAEVKNGNPVHEIIYPHSKLMIVDDYHVIIGSSNINDRSMLGLRDSEVAIHAESQQFAISLRHRIWSVAMGCSESELGMCPSEDAMFKYWCDVAEGNFSIFDELFCVLPNDTVSAMPSQDEKREPPTDDYLEWKARYKNRPALSSPDFACNRIGQLRGTLVKHPLGFLRGEKKIKTFRDLLSNPSLSMTKEGIAQWLNNTLFE